MNDHTTADLVEELRAIEYDATEYAHDPKGGGSCIRVNVWPGVFLIVTDEDGASPPYDPQGEPGAVWVCAYTDESWAAGEEMGRWAVGAPSGEWPDWEDIVNTVIRASRECDPYRYAVGIDGAWGDDVYDTSDAAIAAARDAAAKRHAAGDDGAYPIAVYILRRS